MKAMKVDLKEVNDKAGTKMTYADLIRQALEYPKNHQSMKMAEMREVNKVLRELEKATGFLYLTKAQHQDLVERMENCPWVKASFTIEQFVDDLKSAPEVDLTEPPATPA